MDLDTMRTSLRKKIGNPTTGEVADADLTGYLNTAYRRIANRYAFRKMRGRATFDTVASTYQYSLPSNAVAVTAVRNQTDKVKLDRIGEHQVARYTTDVTTEGSPVQYARFENYIQLFPVPDAVYTIEVYYKVVITALSANADVPVIPESWHEGIVLLARWVYYDEQPDYAKAQYALGVFKDWVAEQPVEVHEETVDLDAAVELPTLSKNLGTNYDWDHSE